MHTTMADYIWPAVVAGAHRDSATATPAPVDGELRRNQAYARARAASHLGEVDGARTRRHH